MKKAIMFHLLLLLLLCFTTQAGADYCQVKGNDQKYEHISGIQVGDFINTSGPSGYSDFTSKTIVLISNEQAAIKLTPGFKDASVSYKEFWRIWVDLNQDKTFSDAEMLFEGSSDSALTGGLKIPDQAKTGSTRLRVTMQYNKAAAACGDFQYGEAEDYTVIIKKKSNPVYCESYSSEDLFEWIGEVTIGEFSYTSAASSYSDFTGQVATVTRGVKQNVTLKPFFSGSSFPEYWKIWMDLNQDGDFNDNGELLFEPSPKETAVTGTLKVPKDALTGTTRMRVAMSYNTSVGPCSTAFEGGEVEDYTVSVEDFTGPVKAVFTYSVVNYTLTLKDESLQGANPIQSWAWDFGDGHTSTEQNPVHVYDSEYTYAVKLTVTDTAGNKDTQTETIFTKKPSPYCLSQGVDYSREWIKNVTIAGASYDTGPSGYEDNSWDTIFVKRYEPTIFSLTPGFSGANRPVYWRVWLDKNVDGDFEDEGELIYANSTPISDTIVTDAIFRVIDTERQTYLRVAMSYGKPPESCGNPDYGEVEDYFIQCI